MSSTDDDPGLGTESPIAGISQPKSKKKLWIFGGLGCLGLIALGVGFIAFAVYFAGEPALKFANENITFIEESDEAADAIGAPVVVGDPQFSKAPGNPGAVIFTGTVKGTNKQGTYTIEALLENGGLERQEIYLEVDGQRIDLDPDAMFELDVDDGG